METMRPAAPVKLEAVESGIFKEVGMKLLKWETLITIIYQCERTLTHDCLNVVCFNSIQNLLSDNNNPYDKLLWIGLFSHGLICAHFHFKTICGILKFVGFEFL